MRQLTFIKPGQLEWHDVPAPKLTADTDALVKPLIVARCDLDLYIASGFVPYPGPFAFGHECVGVVTDAGPRAGIAPGQTVVVPFQLSCGRCTPCRRGFTNTCEAFAPRAAYGLKPTSGVEYGGALSDLMHVPFADHMLVPLPDDVDPMDAASAADNIPDGWRAVAPHLAERPGASVLVIGGAALSVGLYAAGLAKQLGASRVLYLDDDAERRACAETMGVTAEPLNLEVRAAKPKAGSADGSPLAKLATPYEQFEITVDAAGDPKALNFLIASTAPNGVCSSVAIYFGETTPVPLLRMYGKGITFHTGRVHARAALPHVLETLRHGRFCAHCVTSRTVPFAQAAEAMTDPGAKIVFTAEAV
jgi:threonine dehydrogenase-like Zn-dependent dehydrogenase